MRNIIGLFFLILGFGFSLCAQNKLMGRVVYSSTNKPVVSATVTLQPFGSTSILAYTTTSDEGVFSLNRDNLPDSVTVTVAAMTIEKQSKTIKRDVDFVEITVEEFIQVYLQLFLLKINR